ncbi:metallophosphoesterase family protein [Millionella massiliensis]|uniref:metallophosphoesterase family protein n=1 Tax=Millionella massiliensis TaxID=1871023 RepID=UPI0008D9E0BE|nr:metallophosphoesterase family protein [Millionella massiliensis]
MIRIGLISDTHGTFDDPVMRFLDPVEQIWHAGDIGSLELADRIAAFRPLTAVYGNIDDHRVRTVYPKFKHLICENLSVVITHIGGYPGHYQPEARMWIEQVHPRLFISGHSHILKVMNDRRYNLLHMNPGAAGHGYQGIRTALRFVVDDDRITEVEVGEF